MRESTTPPLRLRRDVCSGDPHRVWQACCEIISLSQNRNAILALLPCRRTLRSMARGGIFGRPPAYLTQALAVLDFHARNSGCPCRLLGAFDRPDTQAAEGYVDLVERDVPNYTGERSCTVRCLRCGAQYRVEPEEYHALWWRWTPQPPD